MLVREIMTPDVELAAPDDTIQTAAKLMADSNAGALPVGENDRLVGMVTDRDIAVRAVAQGKAPDRCRVREVMSQKILYVFEDDTAEDAARQMRELEVRRLPVMNRQKRLVGIVSLTDLGNEPAHGASRPIGRAHR
jgi:CBS domain-containing protein